MVTVVGGVSELHGWHVFDNCLCSVVSCCLFQPLRVCVLGPPAVGKTLLVRQLCQYYKLHHLNIAKVIQESIERLVSKEGQRERRREEHLP